MKSSSGSEVILTFPYLQSQDTDEEDSDSQSGESSTPVPVTVTPTPGVVEPETTQEPIEPTVVTDPDAGRGDSLTGLTEDYKTTVFVDKKSYQKGPDPYKSYEIVGKKVAYDMTKGNEVEKYPKVYKVQASLPFEELISMVSHLICCFLRPFSFP